MPIDNSGSLARWVERLLRWGLGAVFVWAGAVKLMDVRAFAQIISRYDLLPDPLLPWAAIGLPALEVLAGLGLILGLRGSLSLVTALLVLFAGALWFGILRGLEIDCGCFSPAEQAQHDGLRAAFMRDLFMLGASLWLHWRGRVGFGRLFMEGKPPAQKLPFVGT